MQIKRMKLDKLRPASYNPRVELKPGDPEFERLKSSIETFGNVEPIVWNKRTGNVVGGHQRLSVLKAMGETETDVSVVELSEDDEKLLNVALNKIKGEWDWNLLPELLASFSPEDVKLSGFSAQEIAILCADVNAASNAVIDSMQRDVDNAYEGENYATDAPEDGENPSTRDFSVSRTTVEFEGASWVVSLIFANQAMAADWLEAHDMAIPKPGTKSTVIRVE